MACQAITWPKVDIINVKKVSVHDFQNVIRSQWVNLLAREKMANNSFKCIILIENMLISTKIKQICYSGPIDKNIVNLVNGLVLNNQHANIWINIDIVHKHIYASFDFWYQLVQIEIEGVALWLVAKLMKT